MGLAWAMGAGGAMARCPLGPYAVLAMGPRYASRMHRLKAHPHASQPPQAQGRSMHTRREREAPMGLAWPSGHMGRKIN